MAVSVYWHGKGEGTGRRWGEEENRGERRGAEGREGKGSVFFRFQLGHLLHSEQIAPIFQMVLMLPGLGSRIQAVQQNTQPCGGGGGFAGFCLAL